MALNWTGLSGSKRDAPWCVLRTGYSATCLSRVLSCVLIVQHGSV